jgi:hypothetical protein
MRAPRPDGRPASLFRHNGNGRNCARRAGRIRGDSPNLVDSWLSKRNLPAIWVAPCTFHRRDTETCHTRRLCEPSEVCRNFLFKRGRLPRVRNNSLLHSVSGDPNPRTVCSSRAQLNPLAGHSLFRQRNGDGARIVLGRNKRMTAELVRAANESKKGRYCTNGRG